MKPIIFPARILAAADQVIAARRDLLDAANNNVQTDVALRTWHRAWERLVDCAGSQYVAQQALEALAGRPYNVSTAVRNVRSYAAAPETRRKNVQPPTVEVDRTALRYLLRLAEQTVSPDFPVAHRQVIDMLRDLLQATPTNLMHRADPTAR